MTGRDPKTTPKTAAKTAPKTISEPALKSAPKGAIFALITAALAAFAMRADPKGLGQDPLARGSTKAIGLGGLIWLGWAALKRALSRRA